jgi:hypothetical protein
MERPQSRLLYPLGSAIWNCQLRGAEVLEKALSDIGLIPSAGVAQLGYVSLSQGFLR